ncbi:MAG: hypothetical protein K8T25_03835 [Planctomycetia bacterium]|nr:hypothetical protein [Planctomycetia bacterium]
MSSTHTLNLMPGDWVEVRSQAEILSTLDAEGRLEGLPFMPEMLDFCGRRFRVYKRADKTCDITSPKWGLRKMTDTVHLALLRCNGAAHGGCQAGCLLFWKEAWLKRAAADDAAATPAGDRGSHATTASVAGHLVTAEQLIQTTHCPSPAGSAGDYYYCQATELIRATKFLPWWDVRQYWRDVKINGLPVLDLLRGLCYPAMNLLMKAASLKRRTYPNVRGNLKKTPSEELNLQPGELVEVKSHAEILATLDRMAKNRGMSFDAEMLPYCGKQFRVLRRVERTIDEKTGRLIRLPSAAIILNDVICTARYHRFCPRSTFPYWREIWLRRVEQQQPVESVANVPSSQQSVAEMQTTH